MEILDSTQVDWLSDVPEHINSNDQLCIDLDGTGSWFQLKVQAGPANPYVSWQAQEYHRHFPEFKKIDDCRSKVPASDVAVEILDTRWRSSQQLWTPDAKRVADFIRINAGIELQNAKLNAAFKTGTPELAVLPFTENSPDLKLAPYQQVAATNAVRSTGYGLFMEQGTGKTPTAIAALCRKVESHSKRSNKLFKVMIVCPKSVRLNWLSELEKFATVPYKAVAIRGGRMERIRDFMDAMRPDQTTKMTVVVCSYESLIGTWPQFKTFMWDFSILDESHFIKTPTTKRFNTVIELRDHSKQRLVLTGTPVTNSAIDLYAQFEFMRECGSGFLGYKNFKKFYGSYVPSGEGRDKLIGIQNLPLMQERLARMSFQVFKSDVLPDLPEKSYNIHEVEMCAEQRQTYKDVATQISAELENALESEMNKTLLVNHVFTRMLRLAQITSGYIRYDAVHDDEGNEVEAGGIHHFPENPKLDTLIQLLEGKQKNQKTIVWACFREDIEMICKRLEASGISAVRFEGATSDADRKQAEYLFNFNPETRVFVGNPAAGGTGLNLLGYPPGRPEAATTNCDQVIYYSQGWSSPIRSQSEDRAHRRGTRGIVQITDLCVPQTIDEEIRSRVTQKRMHALEVADIRRILDGILIGV